MVVNKGTLVNKTDYDCLDRVKLGQFSDLKYEELTPFEQQSGCGEAMGECFRE